MMISAVVVCLGLAHMVAGECSVSNFGKTKITSDGVYVNCEHLYSGFGLTLEECLTATCDVQGNAFNFRTSPVFGTQCYPKKCCGEVVYESGPGYDVYVHTVADYGCPSQLADSGEAAVVNPDADDDEGEVTAQGCHWRGETHAAGEIWIQDLSEGRHKQCNCPDPLPSAWSSKYQCVGACNVDGDPMRYGGQTYEKDGETCRCNAYGRERCR